MRCPDCNKFVSYDEPQCEVGNVELDGDTVRANVTVQLNCQDCGGTLKDAEIEAETEFQHECKPKAELNKDWKPDAEYKKGDDQYEVESDGSAEGTNRTETKDRHGKPIKSSRYMKSFYGFTLESEIKCRKCGEVFSVTIEGEEQASSFNECC
jgi:phage FluMu protein Com